MFKDGSFFVILVQSGNMLPFPGYFSSSRQTLETWFMQFERTYVGVVFDIKIPRQSLCFYRRAPQKCPRFDFSQDAFWATGRLVATSYRISSFGNKDAIK